MTTAADAFIAGLPKAELHLHIEGTLERSLCAELAARNGIALPELARCRRIPRPDLVPGRLLREHAGAAGEADFYDLAMAYFRKAHAQNVVYAEVFFDPQAHTAAGRAFAAVIGGLDRARRDASGQLGLRAQLIMCFLRDLTAESAMATLEQSLPYRDKIIGVGLDSDEWGNPPLKFASVFARARAEGYRLTMHCDVDQEDAVGHIWQAWTRSAWSGSTTASTAWRTPRWCPAGRRPDRPDGLPGLQRLGDRRHEGRRARTMLDRSLLATVNSDDPAYFEAYVNENFAAVAADGGLGPDQLTQLARNSFEIAWLDPAERADYLAPLDTYLR